MKNELRIFFSWQTSSRTDKLDNKGFILSCIQEAANAVSGKGDLKDVTFNVKQGTGGEPGTPDMIATCLKRNDECHIFIADISVDKKFNKIQRWANTRPALRERPNENVMYELGRADGHLGYEQVIHVANTVFGDVCKNDYLRPVDIRHKRRPITFCLADNNGPEAEKVRKELVEDLKNAIKKSAKAALRHIHEEWLPYESCEKAYEEQRFQKMFVFNHSLRFIQKSITDNSRVLRVLGLNGVGKTRLVLETILGEQTEMPQFYCDCLLSTEQEVINTTTKIFVKQEAAILILDNCDAVLFEKVLEIYRRKKVHNRLYAIHDDVEEQKMGMDYNVARFNYAYEDVVDGIISQLYGKQDEVSAKIKEFASGNPLLAVQVIEGVTKTGDIRDFNNRKLISSLLSAAEGSEERVIAEALSLFSSIGYDGDAHKEVEVIAQNKHVAGLNGDATVLANKFDSLIRLYLERGLMQRVGLFVRFRSPAISNLLADEWFARSTVLQIENIILSFGQTGMAHALIPSFFDRLSSMQDNGRVADLVKELLLPGRLLTNKNFLNTEVGSKIYRSLVEVVPDAVCDSLYQAIGGLSLDELKQMRDSRRELVWTLEKLCYKPETFTKAAKMLLWLGCSEVEFVSNNATGQFVSLFPVRLPSTSVSLSDRLDFLRNEINSQEEKPLILKALDRAVCTMNFIHFGGETILGGTKYFYYEPRNPQEIDDYIGGCLDLIQHEIDGNTEYKEDCIKMLASNLRALNSCGLFDKIMPRVEKVAEMLNYEWDDLLKALHFAKNDREVKLDEQRRKRTEELIQRMTKTDFVSRFSQVESFEYNDYLRMSDAERNKVVNDKYEALAVEMVSEKLYSVEILKRLYDCQTFFPHAFAHKLAILNTPEEQMLFAKDSIGILENRANSIFVYYVKEVSEDVFAKIADIIEESGKQWLLFPLVATRDYAFDHPYVNRLIELSEQRKVDLSQFVTYWNYVRIDRLSSPEAVGLLEKLLKLPNSFEVVLHMAMSRYLSSSYNQPEMDRLFEEEMIRRADDVPTLITNPHYAHILDVILSKGGKEDLAKALSRGIFKHIIASDQTSLQYEVETVLSVLFEKYFDIIWQEMAGLISGDDDMDNFFKIYFAFGFSTLYNPFPSLIFKKEHLGIIMDWCGRHVEVGPYRMMSLAPLTDGDKLSDSVMMLIDNYGSDKMVRTALSDKLGTFAGPVSTYDSRAELIVPLTNHRNPDVSTWATLEIERLKSYREQTQKMEESLLMSDRMPSHRWTLMDEENE